MKRTLYLKLLGGYLLFGLLGFLIIATFTYHLTFQHLEKKEAQNLYRESALISSSYAQNYFSNSMTLDEINEQLSALDTYLNADIWIVDTHGKILINTAATETTEETIPDFDMTDFGNRYYRVGTFSDYFQENMLSVFSPITVNYKVRGYVIIHKSESYLTASANSLSAIAYTTLALIFAAAFVVLALFTYVVYIPIRKITHAADEYSNGNFDAKIDVHSNDEIGYLAASLNYMANELNTLEEDQRKFISNVSHDFRSPLTSIKGYVEAMLDGTIPVEMQEKYLNIILFETERLNKLTKSLLELNKFGSHGVMLDVTDFDINQTIKTTLLTFEGICANKHIRFNLILSGEQLFVTADFSKIQQVLYNLIDNAIKFSHPDSTITIETTEKNDKVFVSVKDTGIGIPSCEQKKLFKNYFRGSNVINLKVTGSGIGLMLVYKLVKLHKGRIQIQSTEHQGTCVQITFPKGNSHLHKAKFISPKTLDEHPETIIPSKDTSEAPFMEISQENSSLQRILIVEDNDDLRNYLVDMFKAGYNIQSCPNGKEALIIIREFNPDLVISDIMMPEMTGDELCSIIKGNLEMSHIPVLLLTALGDEKNMLEGLKTGADAYIIKPFSVGILKATVKNILANRALLRLVYNSIEDKEQSLPTNCTNTLDWKFIASVKECIENNMGNSDFNVDILSSQHHMSRTSFFNKLKALTGYAPADYIRMIRLQHAAKLLKQGEYTITEIADKVGFSDAKYFREVFKKYYGVSPSKYVEAEKIHSQSSEQD